MRFCPFCSAENADEATHCAVCARRLPKLPPRRATSTGSDGEGQRPGKPGAPRRAATPTPPPPPRRATSAEGLPAPHSRRSTSGGRPPSAADTSSPGFHLGPAARRRTVEPEPPRSAGDPARRATDRPAGKNGAPRLRTTDADEWDDAPATVIDSEWAADETTHALDPDSDSDVTTMEAEPVVAAEPSPAPERPATPVPERPATPVPERPATPAPERAVSVAPESEFDSDMDAQTRLDSSPGPQRASSARADTRGDGEGPGDFRRLETPPALPEAPRPGSESASGKVRGTTDTNAPPPTRSPLPAPSDYAPVAVAPIPEVPEAGWLQAASYAVGFARARWQRRSAIKELNIEIAKDTAALDSLLGELGRTARSLKVETRPLSAENKVLDEAEARRHKAERECSELSNRQAEENERFGDSERDREQKAEDAEKRYDRSKEDLAALEAQRRGLRDKRKAIDRQQKGLIKSAEDREAQANKSESDEQRRVLRQSANDFRRDAAALDPERQDIERRLSALEKPISQSSAKVEALKLELDSARRGLADVREGHRHRLAEIEAEQGRKTRELAQAEAEIQRRLVTLGTLVNLNRIDRREFVELYERIDGLRGAIGRRATEIDRLTAERQAYDRQSLVRGVVALGAGGILLITVIAIVLAVL